MANQGVWVAFDDATLASNPAGTRIDDPDGYNVVSSWSVERGRSKELDKTQVGRASIKLLDKLGIIDPTNDGSPFAGKIDPLKQAGISLHNPVTDSWSSIFRGFADWSFSINQGSGFKVVEGVLDIEDGFALLADMEMHPGRHGEADVDKPREAIGDVYFIDDQQVDDRIKQALLNAGWPTNLQRIFSGNVAVQTATYARRDSLMQVLLDAADAEFPGVANVYMSKDGKVIFHGRFARFDPFNPQYDAKIFYVGDYSFYPQSTNISPIAGLSFRRSKSDIYNAISSIPKGVSEVEAINNLLIDENSISQYGWRSLSFNELLTLHGDEVGGQLNAIEETQLYAQYYLNNYKVPQTRVTSIRFRPLDPGHYNAPALWSLMCEVEIGDVINLTTSHPGGGGFKNEDFFVEGIQYEASPMRKDIHDVTLTLDVSPRAHYTINPFNR